MHMIFDVKQQDMRYKARLVVGGHVIDSSDYTTYSSVIENISVRLLFLAATHQNLGIMTGDIGNAFPTAPCAEKVWSKCGPEFGEQEGAIVTLQRALYGLKTASRSFHEFFGDTLRRMGFTPTRADQDLRYRKADDHIGYDYIATHVDDIAIAAMRPAEYMNQIEQEFLVRNKEDSPSYYLGNDLQMKQGSKSLHVSNKTYIKEVLRKYQEEHRTLPKKNIPMSPNAHPELDTSEPLDENGTKQYQKIIGIGQWLVVAGRFDINFAISSLSRYAAAPRKGHLDMAEDILGYLKKYPAKGYVINPKPPKIDHRYETVKLKEDFGGQYQYFQEDLDPKFPKPLVPEMDINIFVDANHAHDKVTGRSVTGILCFVGSTPVIWQSKRQASVQTSTFGAEFTALKKAVEEAITLRYYLRSMGIAITKATPIFVDNMSVVLNASNPGSTLNKKSVALSYHFVREHMANSVVEIRKIDSTDNYADPFTKALNSGNHHDFLYEVMCN
jgi:Reverse transcriptase (RNA-dependent DNA polymerase)